MCPSPKCALIRKEKVLRDEQMKEWEGWFWRQFVSTWAGTPCCNGTTQLYHWKKNPNLPSDNCSQYFFLLNYSHLNCLWINCLKNVYLTRSPCVIHVPLPQEPRRWMKKGTRWKEIAQHFIVLHPDSNLSWRDSDLLAFCGPLCRQN